LELYVGAGLAIGVLYLLFRKGGPLNKAIAPGGALNPSMAHLSLGGDISNLEHDIEKMVDDELDMAGNMMHGVIGEGNNSFQNIKRKINLNLGGTDGVNQSIDQSSQSNLSYN
jgi:hypothetical protein